MEITSAERWCCITRILRKVHSISHRMSFRRKERERGWRGRRGISRHFPWNSRYRLKRSTQRFDDPRSKWNIIGNHSRAIFIARGQRDPWPHRTREQFYTEPPRRANKTRRLPGGEVVSSVDPCVPGSRRKECIRVNALPLEARIHARIALDGKSICDVVSRTQGPDK